MSLWTWVGRKIAEANIPPKNSQPVITATNETKFLREQLKQYSAPRMRLRPDLNNPTEETAAMRAAYPSLLKEPTLKAAFFGKIMSVASLDLVVNPGGGKNPSRRDDEIADFIRHCILRRRGNMLHIVESLGYGGTIYGFSVNEKVETVEDRGPFKGKIVLKELKPKPVEPNKIVLEVDEFNNITAIQANAPNGGARFDPHDFAVFTYLKVFGAHTGMSDFRAIRRAVQLKEDAINLRMIFLDKYSGPYLKGKYTTNEVRADLEEALAQARGEGYITIPDGSDVDVVSLAMTGTAEFKAAIDDFDREIAIGINFASLHMMTGKVGEERGNAIVQQQTAEIGQWYMAALVAQCLNEQIIPQFVNDNYGPDFDLPTCQLGGISASDIIADLSIDEKLHAIGASLDATDLYRRAQRPMPDGAPAIIPGVSAMPVGGPATPFRG